PKLAPIADFAAWRAPSAVSTLTCRWTLTLSWPSTRSLPMRFAPASRTRSTFSIAPFARGRRFSLRAPMRPRSTLTLVRGSRERVALGNSSSCSYHSVGTHHHSTSLTPFWYRLYRHVSLRDVL